MFAPALLAAVLTVAQDKPADMAIDLSTTPLRFGRV